MKRKLTPESLRALYPPMDEAFARRVQQSLAAQKEEPIVKRKLSMGAVLALCLVLLAGIAMAVSAHLGVLDFLGGAPVPDEGRQAVQTELKQTGGTLSDVTVRVRDAVSDGRLLMLAVEARPVRAGEMVLNPTDDLNWHDEGEVAYFTGHRDAATLPDVAAIDAASALHFVDCMQVSVLRGEGGSELFPVAGYTLRYEDGGVLVTNLIIDLGRLENPQEELTLQITPTVFRPVDLPREEWPEHTGEYYKQSEPVEETTLNVTVRAGSMTAERAVADVPFSFMFSEITHFEVIQTPLALYVRMASHVVDENAALGWYELLDEQGEPLQYLAQMHASAYRAGQQPPTGPDVIHESAYLRTGALPGAITLHARQPVMLDAEIELPPDLAVPLTPVE